MMTNEILARLQKGESLDDIMNEITAAVNGAVAEKERLDKEEAAKREAEEVAKKEAEALQKTKIDKVNNLLYAFGELAKVWGWTDVVDLLAEVDEEDLQDLVDTLDECGETIKAMIQLGNLTFPLGGAKPKVKSVKVSAKGAKEPTVKKGTTADEVIIEFLKNAHLF